MSSTYSKPSFRRRRLGRRLRALRESSPQRLNLTAAAELLELSRSSLHRLETGETRTTVHIARSMMDLYDAYDEDLLHAVRAALKPGWYTAYGLEDFGYVDLEPKPARSTTTPA